MQLHVGQQSGLVDALDLLDALELNDQFVYYEQI